jgi:uncharacterized protein YukE
MTTLHMDVDTCRSVQSGMTNTQTQINDIMESLTAFVNEMQEGLWLSDSATEFYSLFGQWQRSTAGILGDLGSMASRLQGEIDDWEAAARKLQ